MRLPKFFDRFFSIQPVPKTTLPSSQPIPQTDPWVEYLEDDSPFLRQLAVSHLSRRVDTSPSALGLLFERLEDDSPVVRLAVIRELQTRIDNPEVQENLLKMVEDDDPRVRWEACVASLSIDVQSARERIFSFLKDPHSDNRRSFLLMTPPVQSETERNHLIPFLNDPDPEIRKYSLKQINPTLKTPEEIEAILGTAALDDDFHNSEYQELAVLLLRDRLQDQSASVRTSAVRALSQSLSTSISHSEVNYEFCEHRDPFRFCKWHEESLYNTLKPLFRDPEPQVRQAVVDALGNFEIPFGRQDIVAALNDSDITVVLTALKHLSAVSEELPQETIQKVSILAEQAEDQEVRRQAEALSLIANQAAGGRQIRQFDEALTTLLNAPPFHRDCLYGSVLEAGRAITFVDTEVFNQVAPLSVTPETVTKLKGMILSENAIYQTKMSAINSDDEYAFMQKLINTQTKSFHEENLKNIIGLVEDLLSHAPQCSESNFNKASFTSNDASCVTTLLDKGIDVSLLEQISKGMRNSPLLHLPHFIEKLEKAVQEDLIAGDPGSEKARLELSACRALILHKEPLKPFQSATSLDSPDINVSMDFGLLL